MSLAGSSLSPRATTFTVDSTTSPCETLRDLSQREIHFPALLFILISYSLCFSHFRWGAPPVINPTGSAFPNATLWVPSLSLTLPVTSHSSTTFNLSNPAPGDWYIAAHLPEDDRRIEQKVTCVQDLLCLLVCPGSLGSFTCCKISCQFFKYAQLFIFTPTCSTRAGLFSYPK